MQTLLAAHPSSKTMQASQTVLQRVLNVQSRSRHLAWQSLYTIVVFYGSCRMPLQFHTYSNLV